MVWTGISVLCVSIMENVCAERTWWHGYPSRCCHNSTPVHVVLSSCPLMGDKLITVLWQLKSTNANFGGWNFVMALGFSREEKKKEANKGTIFRIMIIKVTENCVSI